MSWPETPAAATVTADSQAIGLATFLDHEYAQKRGGTVKVMESMHHLWEEILSASDEPRVLVCCTGETPRGSFAEQDLWCRVDRQWTIAVVRGHGFRNLMPDEKGSPVGAVETLCTSVETVRDVVRAMVGLSQEFPVNYKGWKNLPAVGRPGTVNVFVAGATLEFSTANDIPQFREIEESE